jgi:hypothetical protein
MKIVTYNINGIGARLPNLIRWLNETQPDVVGLQELKAPQEKFPEAAIREAGYGVIWVPGKGESLGWPPTPSMFFKVSRSPRDTTSASARTCNIDWRSITQGNPGTRPDTSHGRSWSQSTFYICE